jgi:putative peptidoglycan lipid II flippase
LQESIAEISAEQTPQLPRSVARSAGVVSLAVMASRLLGLVREQVFAALFGAGFLSDAFQVGFRIPNTLRDLFAEGALSSAFVKTFTDYIVKKDDEKAAWRVASLLMNACAILLSLISIAGILLAPWIVGLIAHDFSPEKAHLATVLMRIMFPFIVMVSLASVAMGVLNTKGHFGVPASASTLFNVGAILGGVTLAYFLSGGGWLVSNETNVIPSRAAELAVIGMAIGTLIGGSLQFLIQIPSLLHVGFRFRRGISFSDPGIRQVARLMMPALIGTAAVQVNVFVDTFFASSINGAPSWLAYSFRLMQFPIGLFGVAIGTATLPTVSLHAARGDLQSLRKTLNSSLSLVFFLALPSACGLIVLAKPIVALLFQHGVFTARDTHAVAWALAGWSIGLVGFAAIRVLSPVFYAMDDTRTPMLVSLFSITINAVGDYFFMKWLMPFGIGHAGLALSTSLVAIINFVLLAFFLRRRVGRFGGRELLKSVAKVMLASVALGLTSYGAYYALSKELLSDGLIVRAIEAFVPIAAGGIVFLATCHFLGIKELEQVRRAVVAKFATRDLT